LKHAIDIIITITFMKNVYVFGAVFLMVSILGCQDTKDGSGQPDIAYQKSIGTQISVETATRWMNTLDQKNGTQGREDGSPYSITASRLDQLRSSVDDLIGVVFHHAIDDAGLHHFIILPIDNSLSVWDQTPGRIYVDANTNEEINRSTAARWAEAYKQQHQNEIWFHFFGSNIFDEITAIPYFTTLQIEPALNDLTLAPQVLLIVEDEAQIANTGGRYQAESTVVYDASSPCPPCPIQ
jgi:hypothetical protein